MSTGCPALPHEECDLRMRPRPKGADDRTVGGPNLQICRIGVEAGVEADCLGRDLLAPTHAMDWAAEVERVVGLGATRVAEFDEYGTRWVTLTDPEGNVFDIGAG